LAIETQEWDRIFDVFYFEQQQQREALLSEHEKAQARYELKWQDPNALIPFSKPSPELLRLRKMQKSLALAKRFKEPRELKEKADAMQIEEARAGEERAKAAIRCGFQALRERQQKEIVGFDGHEERLVTFLELEKARSLEPTVMLIKTLEAAIEPNFLPEKPREGGVRKGAVVTPRARTQLKEFKGSDEPQKLNLNALAVRRFAARKRKLG